MNPTAWEQAKDVITEALKRAPADRVAFVRERCPNPALAGEIITLLAAYRDDADFLADPPDDPNDELEAGTRVGPYVIIESIGRGGMGHVFLGSDPRLRRKVALKCVIRSIAGSGERRLRILHEARAAAAVMHPNVATIHDVVEHENRAFIVMEYVEGESLAARLKRERLPIDRVIAIGRQLSSALTAAHAKHVVHRDLKPGNIHFATDGTVKILDFGIANTPRMATTTLVTGRSSAFDPRSLQPTTRGPQPGTPAYMSPEQLMGHSVDERSDIYSLGLVLFEMATGRRPYRETGAPEVILAIANGIPRADQVDPRVPGELADVIAKALARDIEARYQSAADLMAALERVDAELRDHEKGPGELIRRWAARVAVGILMVPPAVFSLGFLNSLAFNTTLSRTGPFAAFGQETTLDYFIWGLKSLVAPLAYVVAATIVFYLAKFVFGFLLLWPAVATPVGRARRRIAAVGLRLRLDDPVVQAEALATLGVIGIAIVFWWFFDLNRAWASGFINNSPAEWFRPLNPQNSGRAIERLILTLMTFAFGVGLARVIARRRERKVRRGIPGLMLLALTVAVMVVIADMPYRLFQQSDFERVDLGTLRCYDIGQSADEILVYCPETSPPRNRIVKRSDSSLHRLGIVESIFALQPSSRPGF